MQLDKRGWQWWTAAARRLNLMQVFLNTDLHVTYDVRREHVIPYRALELLMLTKVKW